MATTLADLIEQLTTAADMMKRVIQEPWGDKLELDLMRWKRGLETYTTTHQKTLGFLATSTDDTLRDRLREVITNAPPAFNLDTRLTTLARLAAANLLESAASVLTLLYLPLRNDLHCKMIHVRAILNLAVTPPS